VIFHTRFFSPKEMAGLVGSADIYITPYCHEAQAVSGTLAYAMGAGKAIISTPYWHAAELLNDGRGALVPFENPAAIAAAAIELLDSDAARQAMRSTRLPPYAAMVWNRVAQSYMRAFVRARVSRMEPASLGIPSKLPNRTLQNDSLSLTVGAYFDVPGAVRAALTAAAALQRAADTWLR